MGSLQVKTKKSHLTRQENHTNQSMANSNIMVTLETLDLKSKGFCNAEQLISCLFLEKPTQSIQIGHNSEA